MDMSNSNVIQTRAYSAREASLLQRNPLELIESQQGRINRERIPSDYRKLDVNYAGAGLLDPMPVVGLIGTGGASRILRSIDDTARAFGTCALHAATYAPTSIPTEDDLDTWILWAGHAYAALQQARRAEAQLSTATARLRSERVAALQAVLGLTMRDLAAVLGITRQQLYKWIDEANDVKLQEASRIRLSLVERLSREWLARSTIPLSAVVHEALAAGGTLFDRLSGPSIDSPAVIAAFDEIGQRLQGRPKTPSERMAESGFTRRPSARSLPSDE
jgi:DNA-binding transcriptional regulator YiaG